MANISLKQSEKTDPLLVGGENTLISIELDNEDDQVLVRWEINGEKFGRNFHKDFILKALFEYINQAEGS